MSILDEELREWSDNIMTEKDVSSQEANTEISTEAETNVSNELEESKTPIITDNTTNDAENNQVESQEIDETQIDISEIEEETK